MRFRGTAAPEPWRGSGFRRVDNRFHSWIIVFKDGRIRGVQIFPGRTDGVSESADDFFRGFAMSDFSPHSLASSKRLLELFREGFSVMDLAEPLLSLDETASRAEARELLAREDVPLLGVRRGGRAAGYVTTEDLAGEGDLSSFRPFSPEELLDETASLSEVMELLSDRATAFVRVLGTVACVVGRCDLEKPPMRMWLFGVISILEMNVVWVLRELYPGDSWSRLITESRLEKARDLQEERRRRGQHSDLLSCLQFSDKLQILIKEERNRKLLGIESRRQGDKIVRQFESLRNNLAHSQPVVEDNWEAIQSLREGLGNIVSARRLRTLLENLGS